MEIISVPLIVSVVFSILEGYKFVANKSKYNKTLIAIIPIVGAVIGVILGIVCFYAFPSIIAAGDIVTAILVGGASGLSATGCNQIFKQLQKLGIEIKDKEDGSDGQSGDN